jgi:hypothetical protein
MNMQLDAQLPSDEAKGFGVSRVTGDSLAAESLTRKAVVHWDH